MSTFEIWMNIIGGIALTLLGIWAIRVAFNEKKEIQDSDKEVQEK